MPGRIVPLACGPTLCSSVMCSAISPPRASALVVALSASVLLTPVAQTQARLQPFAPGIVSTEAPEFAATFTPDGGEVYFNRASADRSTLTIMTSRRSAAGAWSNAIVAPFSGTHRDVDPFIATDGQRVYFSSDRPRVPDGPRLFATWFVERTASGWGPPIDAGSPLNSTAGDVFFTMARDGTAVFTSSRDGGSRTYTARLDGSRWNTPTPLTFGTASEGGNPAIAPSGRFIVLVKVPAGGSADLFFSCRSGVGWSEPRALAALNSAYADFAPNIDAAERTLTSRQSGPVSSASSPLASGRRVTSIACRSRQLASTVPERWERRRLLTWRGCFFRSLKDAQRKRVDLVDDFGVRAR